MCNKGQTELQIYLPLNNQTVFLNNASATKFQKFEKAVLVVIVFDGNC